MTSPCFFVILVIGATTISAEILNKNAGSRIVGATTMTVPRGSRVTLTCFVNVNDLPNRTLSWYKEGTLLTNANVRDGIKIYRDKSEIGTKSILIINNINPDEGGSYSCAAATGKPSYVQVNVLGGTNNNNQQGPPPDNGNNQEPPNNGNNQRPPVATTTKATTTTQTEPTTQPTTTTIATTTTEPAAATTTEPATTTTSPDETKDYDTTPEAYYYSSTTTHLPANTLQDEELDPYTEEYLLNSSSDLFASLDDTE